MGVHDSGNGGGGRSGVTSSATASSMNFGYHGGGSVGLRWWLGYGGGGDRDGRGNRDGRGGDGGDGGGGGGVVVAALGV